MKLRRVWFPAVVGFALATPASAQTCRQGEPIGWLGLSYRCTSCTISSDSTNPSRFASEPAIIGLDAESPFAGLVRTGDIIVSIDGQLITSARGGMAITTARPGQVLVLQVRRDGALHTVQSRPLPLRCPSGTVSARAVTTGPGPSGGTGRIAAASAGPITTSGLGFSVSCSQCSVMRDGGRVRWNFPTAPDVATVAPGSAADRAGIRRGDRVVAIDGVDITSAEAGERFGAIAPGTTVQLTLQRGGERFVREITAAGVRSSASNQAGRGDRDGAAAATGPRDNTLRYAGRLGTVDIDVRGSHTVTVTETADEVIITTADAVIRLRKK